MSPRPAIALLVLALSAAGATPSTATTTARDWNQTFPVSGRPTVRILTNDGRIRVQTGPPGSVKAAVHYSGRHWGVKVSGDTQPRVELTQSGNLVSVLAHEPSFAVVIGGVTSSLTIDVTVPADCDLEVRSGDGGVHVLQPIQGRVQVTTGDGGIRLRGVRGVTQLSTGDGTIVADSLDGDLDVRSGDGRIDVAGRFDRVMVRSADGGVRAIARTGSRIGTGWQLETGDGSLTVSIPRTFSAELDARTDDGRLEFQLPVKLPPREHRREVRGLLNEGGAPLTLRTRDGRLTLKVSD